MLDQRNSTMLSSFGRVLELQVMSSFHTMEVLSSPANYEQLLLALEYDCALAK